MPHQSLPPFFPSSGPGGQCPLGTSPASCSAWPATPPTCPPGHTIPCAQPRFSLSLFVGCGHRGLCSGAPQASQRPCSRALPPRPPALYHPAAAMQPSHPFIAAFLSCLNQTIDPPPTQYPLSLFCLSKALASSLPLWAFALAILSSGLLFSVTFVPAAKLLLALPCPPSPVLLTLESVSLPLWPLFPVQCPLAWVPLAFVCLSLGLLFIHRIKRVIERRVLPGLMASSDRGCS